MADAMNVGIYPLVEHDGNVFVHKRLGALNVYLVDVDGCVP